MKMGKRRSFKHLSKTQRNQLEMLLKANVKKTEIAEYLGIDLSTVYREIKKGAYKHRNSDWTESVRYSADKADYKYRKMLKKCFFYKFAKSAKPSIQHPIETFEQSSLKCRNQVRQGQIW